MILTAPNIQPYRPIINFNDERYLIKRVYPNSNIPEHLVNDWKLWLDVDIAIRDNSNDRILFCELITEAIIINEEKENEVQRNDSTTD